VAVAANMKTDVAPQEKEDRTMIRHELCAQRYFEDFEVGERMNLPRTMTDALFAAFQLASGDNHPVHYDVEYCRAHGMPHMLAHGFQVLIQTAAGAGLFPHMVEESLKGFIEQSSRFLAPVYVGDTLYCSLTVSELIPGRTTGVLVMQWRSVTRTTCASWKARRSTCCASGCRMR
jgi:acyl dehydratase